MAYVDHISKRSVEDELKARIILQDPPPRLFLLDPMDQALDVADFLRLGLPPRPIDSNAIGLWLEMVTATTSIGDTTPQLRDDIAMARFSMFAGDGSDTDTDGPRATPVARGRFGSSRNWCGAAIFPNSGDQFVQVLGSWRIPAVREGDGAGPWVCSTWIGLDGLRRWMTSMPQMGTTQVVGDTGETYNSGAKLPNCFAWWQWWLRGRSIQLPVVLPTCAIMPGTKVYCCVTLLPADQPKAGERDNVQFFLSVNGVGRPVIVRAPPQDNKGDPVPTRGASAEWILERPTALHDSPNGIVAAGRLYPLPMFDSAGSDNFAACLASSPDTRLLAGNPAPAQGPATNFRTPRLLRMTEQRDDSSRLAIIAKPIGVKHGRVTVVRKP